MLIVLHCFYPGTGSWLSADIAAWTGCRSASLSLSPTFVAAIPPRTSLPITRFSRQHRQPTSRSGAAQRREICSPPCFPHKMKTDLIFWLVSGGARVSRKACACSVGIALLLSIAFADDALMRGRGLFRFHIGQSIFLQTFSSPFLPC